MIRQTSIETYNQIKEEGLLSKLRFEVYSVVFNYGPMTQGECWKFHFLKRQRHDVCPRFAELEKLGVIKCIGERPCKITGRNSMLWEVTKNLPIKLEKPKRHKCKHCDGRGYIMEQQVRLF